MSVLLRVFLSFVFLNSVSAAAAIEPKSAIDWKQAPVACVEEIVPHQPTRMCPDFTKVANPIIDWPVELPAAERAYWDTRPKEISICRAREILAREAMTPGSQKPVAVEISWMQVQAAMHFNEKIIAIYDASEIYHIPVQVLAGALDQESLFAELGISEDGENFSCGIGQLNVLEYCRWANSQTTAEKALIGWPVEKVECDSPTFMQTSFVRPFHSIAKKRLAGLPEYRLNATHFEGIKLDDVISELPAASIDIQKLRVQVIRSFIDHCSEARRGILGKAHELARLYEVIVPAGLRSQEHYGSRERHYRGCSRDDASGVYPLQTGWLMAVAAYNAGSRVLDAVTYYNRMSADDLNDVQAWQRFNPQSLIESLYGAGKYDAKDKKLEFKSVDGSPRSWSWFKACVVQRHIARVIQRATLSNAGTILAVSLEGKPGCIQDGEPSAERQKAKGVRSR